MSKYLVTVTESHTYAVEVFASSIEEAEARAEKQISRGDRPITVSGIYDTELDAVLVEAFGSPGQSDTGAHQEEKE